MNAPRSNFGLIAKLMQPGGRCVLLIGVKFLSFPLMVLESASGGWQRRLNPRLRLLV